jgi:hypothetical protein
MVATLLLLMTVAAASLDASLDASTSKEPPAAWPAYANHSCHAVGPNARIVKLKNATHAQCAAACAAKGCLCYDMLVDGDGKGSDACTGTIDGVIRTSPNRIAYTNSTAPPPSPSPPPRPPPAPPPAPPGPLELKYVAHTKCSTHLTHPPRNSPMLEVTVLCCTCTSNFIADMRAPSPMMTQPPPFFTSQVHCPS